MCPGHVSTENKLIFVFFLVVIFPFLLLEIQEIFLAHKKCVVLKVDSTQFKLTYESRDLCLESYLSWKK